MKLALFVLAFFIPFSTSAQESDWEKLIVTENETEDDPLLMEYLQSLQRKPMDINRASAHDLQTLPWIDPPVAHRIIAFRRNKGSFNSLRQLLMVAGMSEQILAMVAPFLQCRDVRPITTWSGTSRLRCAQPLQKSRGFLEKKYPGQPSKTMFRIQSHVSSLIQWGVLLERDGGECSINDYRCGYAQIQMNRPDVTMILGHLTVASGQGLVFTSPSQWSSDWNALAAVKQRELPLRPYLSSDENGGLYGAAVHWLIGRFEFTGLWSSTIIDASIEGNTIRGFPASGFHRTTSELDDKDRTTKTAIGGVLQWQPTPYVRMGLSLQKSGFTYPIKKEDRPDNLFAFSGKRNRNAGINWDATICDINWFGEIAWSARSVAVKSGVWWDWGEIRNVLSLENIPPLFHNMLYPHLTIPEKNQRSYRWAMKWQTSAQLGLSFLTEKTIHPWLRYHLAIANSQAEQYMTLLEEQARKNILITLRGKAGRIPISKTLSDGRKKITEQYHYSLLGQIDYDLLKIFSLRMRLEWNNVTKRSAMVTSLSDSQGVAFYQQGQITLKKRGFICLRTCWFNSPSYENRFYEFERDLPGLMRIKMVYGQGFRWFLLLSLRFRSVQISAKYEETRYLDRDTIGSGWDEITGNREKSASVQCDIHW
jgi:hypothetical protein